MGPHTVTIVTPGTTTDAYGNEVLDYAAATQRDAAAFVQPLTSEEILTARDAVEFRYKVFLSDPNVSAVDRVIYDGETFEVAGHPRHHHARASGYHHTVLHLRRWKG